MADPTGEANRGALRLDFDRRLILQFRGSVITSDAGLLPYRELNDAVGLTDTGADTLADARTGKNGRHPLVGLLRQSVFSRLAGYEEVNDADRLCRDPVMRRVVGDRAIQGAAASASQMGRFEVATDRQHLAGQDRLFSRPVGRPPLEVRRYYASFSYQVQSWKKPRRVVAKVEWHPGQLWPTVDFIVTNLARPGERIVAFYNHRGACEQYIKEGKARSSGQGCHAVPSPPTPSAFSSMCLPTTRAPSCERWR